MLAQLSSIPIWLHLLALLIAAEAIASRLIIRPDTVNYGDRTAPPQHIQDNINKATWALTFCYLVVICFFWAGHNWARIFVLVGSTISLFNALLSFKMSTSAAKAYMVFDTAFSAFVIFYLLRPSVAAYFTALQ